MTTAPAIPLDSVPVWGHKINDHIPRGIKLAEVDKTSTKEKPIDPSDPRWFVKAVAIPTPDHVGLKIKARHLISDNAHYNPSEPKRESARVENYRRRLVQHTLQGFHSANHKPYQGLGDPMYLDPESLILHALGQLDESAAEGKKKADQGEGDNGNGNSQELAKINTKIPPVKFVLQRARKDLNNVSNEEKGGRRRIRNVKLGHAVKQQLKQEIAEKQGAKLAEENKKREMLKNAWRPPRLDSDDEASDAETDGENDLSHFVVPYNPPNKENTEEEPNKLFGKTVKNVLLPNLAFFSNENVSKKSRGTSSATWRQKLASARPFTPLHTSITAENFSHWPEKESLFRQLCALYWILEAMNLEPHLAMSPITTSWYLDDIGGTKIAASKQADAKKIDSDWSSWKKFRVGEQGQHTGRTKKMSIYPMQRRTTQVLATPDTESRSTMSSSQSLNASTNHSGATTLNNPPIGEDGNQEIEKTKPRPYTRLSFASDIHGEKESETEEEANYKARMNSARKASLKRAKDKKLLQESEEFAKQLDSINREEMDTKLQALANPKDKRSSSEYRADVNIRPKSAPWVLEYENVQAPSNKWRTMPTRLRQKFEEITEEKALMLHDAVEAKDRERHRVMQSKLLYLSTGVSKEQIEAVDQKVATLYRTGNRILAKAIESKVKSLSQESGSFHRAVDWMRTLTKLDQKVLEKSHSSNDQPWYMDLKANIPDEMQQEWHLKKILALLGKYGQINSAKQSAYKFLDVLCKLREWEICSPDIASAVEFCRDRIVEMSVEDYEAWFKNQFPMISRPQTAPPNLKTENLKDTKERVKVRSHKSAPPTRTS